ncbi:MAG: bifunctional MaoC family dehydratase N-terminal/OB-fold nucleic acid binding domain-containing protein [Actinomycetota bacterium]
MTDAKAAYLEQLRAWTGIDSPQIRVGLDPVNEAMIRHWCEAVGDQNPVYTDAEQAARSVHGGIVAPPTMLGAWTMRPLEMPPRNPEDPRTVIIDMLDEAGFTAVVATNCDQEYMRYLRPGDRLTAHMSVDDVSEEKNTALGPGHFFTTVTTYKDQNGEVVGVERFRMLKYTPKGTAPKAAEKAKRPRPSVSQDTAFFWDGAARGELLIQRCVSCGTLRHPPRPGCAACGSLDWDTVRASGRGTVYSFVIYHHPPIPGFDVPYAVGLIELEEGVRMLTNVVDVPLDEIEIGMPVEVTFVAVDDELTLPMFRRR